MSGSRAPPSSNPALREVTWQREKSPLLNPGRGGTPALQAQATSTPPQRASPATGPESSSQACKFPALRHAAPKRVRNQEAAAGSLPDPPGASDHPPPGELEPQLTAPGAEGCTALVQSLRNRSRVSGERSLESDTCQVEGSLLCQRCWGTNRLPPTRTGA